MYFNKFSVRFLIILLLIFDSFIVFSQENKADLLTKWQKAKSEKGYRSDTASVNLLNQLSEQLLYNHADSALYFAKQALQLSLFQKYAAGQAVSWGNIGRDYYVLGDYTLSLDAAARLRSISTKINYQPGVAGSYQIIGLVYLAQDKNDDAISNFKKALELFSRLNDLTKTGKIYFDIGICYDEGGQSEKAFYNLNKAVEIANRIKDNELLSMTLNRIGETYFHIKNYKKALFYYQQVIASKFTSNWERDFAYSGEAQTYYAIGKYDQAIDNAQKSLDLARKVNSAFDIIRALNILSESYAAAKDYEEAYIIHVQLKKTNDSLFNLQKEKEVNYLHLKRQQAENIRLQNDIKDKEQTIILAKRLFIFRNIAAVCVIIFVLVIIRNVRRQKELNKILLQQNADIAAQKEEILQQKEELHEINRTKDQLFSVISHDLRGPFTSILQTMELVRSGDINREEQGVILDEFYKQVNLVALMVNNLLAWASSQQSGTKLNLTNLDLKDVVNEIVSISTFLAKNKNIGLHHNYKGEKLINADLDHVKIIIQNLIGNAIKFTPKGGEIEIYYSEDENYQVIHVKDTGIGIAPEKMEKLFKVTGKEISAYGTNNETGAGIGLALIKQFVDSNAGKLEVQSRAGEGSEFSVYFKKALISL